MSRRLSGVWVVAFVSLGALSAAYGADGSGRVCLTSPIDDPAGHIVPLSRLDGSGFLRGDVTDVTNSRTARAYSGSLEFYYAPAGADRFHYAETTAYYHITEYWNYIQSLGVSGPSYAVPTTVYASELFGGIMWVPIGSAYHPDTRSITLAATVDGTTSYALDAHVTLHEYTHAVEHGLRGGGPGQYAWPETTATEQALALFEGVADYLSASRLNDPRWGKWMAADWTGGPFVRNVDNFYRWPQNFVPTNPYPTGMILSGALWDLRSAAGQAVADTLTLKMVQAVPDNNSATPELNTTFADALTAILGSDAALYGGAHEAEIRQAFAAHGIGTYDFSTLFPMVRDPGDNYDDLKEYSYPGGASALKITFDEFITRLDDLPYSIDEFPGPDDAKATADWLTILDGADNVIGTFTGRQLQGATITVPGDTVKFHLVTDSVRSSFGYRVVDIDAVPEPATLGLIALGLVSLLRRRRQRK